VSEHSNKVTQHDVNYMTRYDTTDTWHLWYDTHLH